MNISITHTPEINAYEIPEKLIQVTIKDISFQPAVDLSTICDIVARKWAKIQGMEHYRLAIMRATSWEEWSRYSVYKRYHCTPVEQALEILGYKFIKHDSWIYYYKGNSNKILHWLHDDFRGTMENPF